jgi:ribose transport system substrate-binding protein
MVRYGLPFLLVALIVSACSQEGTSDDAGREVSDTSPSGEAPSLEFKGPNGEIPAPSDELSLTEEEEAEVRDGNYTAAFVWHENSPFTQAVEFSTQEKFQELGIEVIASTSAEFDAARQAANVETVLARNPDVIITIPVDPVAAAEAFRPAVDQGVKLVVLSVPPEGYVHGKDFVGIATGNIPEYGKIAAELLGEALGGEGSVGWIFHDADFWVTNMRDQAFKDWLEYLYPDTEVVAEAGFSDPARTGDIGTAMLTRNPDLDAVYVAWSVAAAPVLESLRANGHTEVKVVTHDLDAPMALDMCQTGQVIGIVANPTTIDGDSLATMAAYGILDKPAPEMVATSPIPVTAENIVEGWHVEFGKDPPPEVMEACSE